MYKTTKEIKELADKYKSCKCVPCRNKYRKFRLLAKSSCADPASKYLYAKNLYEKNLSQEGSVGVSQTITQTVTVDPVANPKIEYSLPNLKWEPILKGTPAYSTYVFVKDDFVLNEDYIKQVYVK